MNWRTRVLGAGAAALLFSQTAYAAPAFHAPAIDPLVSLSALGTAASRAAVCAGSTAAVAGAATAMAQGPAPGCVLPVTAPPPVAAAPPVAEALPPPPPPAGGMGIGTLPLLLGLAAIIGVAALVLSGDDDNDGDVTPVSPA